MSLEHKKRVISALVGVMGLLAIYFALGHLGLVLIIMAISIASYYEFLSFSGPGQSISRWLALGMGSVLSLWLCFELPGSLQACYLAALAILLHGLWQVHSQSPGALAAEFAWLQSRIFGLFYTIAFPSFVPRIHNLAHGPALLLLLIGIIWLGDIGAYYGGKSFGKNKLSPAVSPGKTREGAVAALGLCAVWAFLYGSLTLGYLPAWKWILIAALTSVVAQAGDLLESLMKRAYSVKDSGGLIPGHGGVFDRFDSLILAAPFFYLLLSLTT